MVLEHSMQRKPCEKTEGGMKENGVFRKLQTIPWSRITEFERVWDSMVRSKLGEVNSNHILEGLE